MPDNIDFTRMHEELVQIVTVAIDLGWTARSQRGGVHLSAPNSTKTVMIPRVRQINNDRLHHFRRTIVRYADPDRRREAQRATQAYVDSPSAGARVMAETMPSLVMHEAFDVPIADAPPRRTLRPYHARRGAGNLYESGAVLEVVENGRVTGYRCSLCDYEAPTPGQVSSHYGRRKDHPPAGPQAPIVATQAYEPEHRDYRPSDRLVRMLAHALETLDNQPPDWTEVARIALTWVHDRPDLPDTETREREPMSDAEILDRIRSLVVGEEATKLRAENDRLVAELAQAQQEAVQGVAAAGEAARRVVEEVAMEADRRVAEVEGKLAKSRAEWDALRALLSSEEVGE